MRPAQCRTHTYPPTDQQRRSEQLLYQLFPNFIADQLRKGERTTAETYPEVRVRAPIVMPSTVANRMRFR